MADENAASKLVQAFTGLAKTQTVLERLPPNLQVATGHDDEVYIFLRRVTDANATMQVIMPTIKLSQASLITQELEATGGLIKQRYHIDDAYRLKDDLETVGTEVEFVRPDEYAH